MNSFVVFSAGDDGDPLINCDTTMLNLFAVQLAGNVIHMCRKNEPNEHKRISHGGSFYVNTRMNRWADHGVLNAALSQVQFLYGLVKAKVEGHNPTNPDDNRRFSYFALLDIEGIKLIADALSIFQEWKTEYIRREKLEHGEHWGNATGWNKAVYDEHVAAFLALYK